MLYLPLPPETEVMEEHACVPQDHGGGVLGTKIVLLPMNFFRVIRSKL